MFKSISLALFLLFSLVDVQVSCAQKNAQNHLFNLLENADSLSMQKQLDRAEELYQEAMDISLKAQKLDTVVLLYNKLGILKWKGKDYQAAENLYKAGLKFDTISKAAADFYYNISLTKRKIKQRDSSLHYLNKSIELYDQLGGSKGAYNVYLHAGRIYKNLQQYDKSLEYLLRAFDGFTELNDLKKLASTAEAIAQIQDKLGNSEKAFTYYYQSIRHRQSIGDSVGLGISYHNIAIAHNSKKNYDSAVYYYNKALDLKQKGTLSYAKTLFNLGLTQYLKGNIESAKTAYQMSLETKIKLRDTLSMFYNINELILVNIELGNFEDAKKHIDLSNILLSRIEVPAARYRNFDLQSYYYYEVGDFKLAYEFQKKYAKLYRTVFNAQQAEIVQELQEKYESEKREKENLSLKLQNKDNLSLIGVQQSKIKRDGIVIILLGLCALLLLLAYLFMRQRQNMLKKQQEYVRLEAIYEGQETIKRSISKDLHDIVGSNLSGIKLKLEALASAKEKEKLRENIIDGVSEINEQVRLISHRLSPLDENIKKYKLSDIIVSRLSEFKHYNHIDIELNNEIPETMDNLPIDAQTNLYGILLEVLSNISKHAKATLVEIVMKKKSSDDFQLIVKDNGIGFDVSNVKGIGLINIEQRASLLRGTAHVMQSEDKGTIFNLKFPLKG
ncbi:tetratricopeptide repeat-containing sensor histidine kinase [Winogradskyella sp.]|uniref:ATP-binding protein n=1 Tax=Winogradskyella sp. TaxID=1883156 RepID=UPI00263345B7|nr:tetratricopeptide repeat-containing sensor histidine kinase [Winogradskyella sp.]